jgi:hypothetical protein
MWKSASPLQIQQVVSEDEGVGLLVDAVTYRCASSRRVRREGTRVDALQGASTMEVQLNNVTVETEKNSIIGEDAG